MKKLKNNKKGFTLIELLAVIVILAILVMVAIPAVTRYLNAARQGTFADNAQSAISAVRTDVIKNGLTKTTYSLNDINNLLEKKLNTSSFGNAYSDKSYITVTQTEETDSSGKKTGSYTYTYKICLADSTGHGLENIEENAIKDTAVKMSGVTCEATQTP